MIKRLFEFLLFGILWELLKLTSSQFLSFANSTISWLTLIGWVVLIVLIAILQWRNTSKGNGTFAFKFTGNLLSMFNVNNPDLFPSLNEAALKKHIALAVSNCPFGKSVKKVLLIATTTADFQYLLLVVSKTAQHTKGLKQYWDRQANYIFSDNFIEVYRNRPSVTSLYQENSFWYDWNITAVSSLDEVPNGYAIKKFKWILY